MLPASAGAYVIQDFAGFTSGTNGIALGPDGNFWVAEEFAGTVARMTPAGQYRPVHVGPVAADHVGTAGPGGTVWVSVKGRTADRIDIATTTVTPIPSAGAGRSASRTAARACTSVSEDGGVARRA